MGLALFAFSALSQPFHAFAHWFHPGRDTHEQSPEHPAPTFCGRRDELLTCGLTGIAEQSRPPIQEQSVTAGTTVLAASIARRHTAARLHSAPFGTTGPGAASLGKRSPVRVLHPASRSEVGRMVIAGRMADVCAELERMAACETWRH